MEDHLETFKSPTLMRIYSGEWFAIEPDFQFQFVLKSENLVRDVSVICKYSFYVLSLHTISQAQNTPRLCKYLFVQNFDAK